MRLFRRGPASAHPCIACGRPADDWALQHRREGVVVEHDGGAFSRNLDDYAPMCTKHHLEYDLRRSTCRHGHALTPDNLAKNGRGKLVCRECKISRKRKR